jgi:uncharacterized protein YcbK (DUF882 family)
MSRAGLRAAVATMVLLLGNQGLETAVANGDTRTLSLHHIHTDTDITITYKRNGRYDEDALKKLDWFVRDWRQEEAIHMDPQLFDLIWEVSREVGGDSTIHVVCGYRSPGTNAMLRRRSKGVAQFSQHTLGKAMDFYIPGAALEELRNAGLRMQRGGVGYYPSSGSPFVHLDVGGVRYWPRMSREQLARIFPDGRTVYLPADGRPLSGYALALADIEKRGSGSSPASGQKKSLFAALFAKSDEEEDAEPAKAPAGGGAVVPAISAAVPGRGVFTLASANGTSNVVRDAMAPPVPVPTARPARFAAFAQAAARPADPETTGSTTTRSTLSGNTATGSTMAGSTIAGSTIASSTMAGSTIAGSTVAGDSVSWPAREADNDRVPLDMLMAYAEHPRSAEIAAAPGPQPIGEPEMRSRSISELALRPQPIDEPTPPSQSILEPAARGFAEAAKLASVRSITTVAKKNIVRAATTGPAAPAEPIRRAAAMPVVANAGMRYDDPWLRAVILAPSLSTSMTANLYGERDMTELRALMNKPTAAVAMSFEGDAYPGISAAHFSGEAVVFLTTLTFERRTASLR